ncbi:MAG: hypothetical protein HOY71_06075, partial [Nonomuraea sp.]|nr:hypothetical protein [Nonomuraea sp.]
DLQRFLTTTRTGPTPVLSGAVPAAYATGAMATVSRGSAPMAQVAPAVAPQAPPLPWVPAPRPHLSGPMQQVDPGYRRCTHPILPALRQAIAYLLMDFPLVHHVWISEAGTASGATGIMLHVKVHMSAAEDVVRDLHRLVRARLPQFAASGAPILMARVADARSERRMIEIGAHVVCADVRE